MPEPCIPIRTTGPRSLPALMLLVAGLALGGCSGGDFGRTRADMRNDDMHRWLGAEATGSDAEFVPVGDDALLAAEVTPWTELPLWTPDQPDWAGIWQAGTARARAAGLHSRPVEETVRDTWAWIGRRGPRTTPYMQGSTPLGIAEEKEQKLLAGAV